MIAVCIGTDTVEGVEGTGIGIAFGVLFSSSTRVFVFEGVVNDSIGGAAFCIVVSPCEFKSSNQLMILDFDDAVEEMGEKGFRIIGDCGSQAPKECFFIGKPAMSKPLLPAKQWTEMRKIMGSKEQEDQKG